MFYFVSSWYSKSEKWNAEDSPWYRGGSPYAFDDTINQIRMFHAAGEQLELMILSYAPGVRLFLHRQNLYPIPFWSAFDAIQGIHKKELGMLSYLELPWPRNIVWRNTPFAVVGFLNEKRYVQVEFGEEGRLLRLDYYDAEERLHRRDSIDDRGFCSSSLFYENGKPCKREYYDADGVLQFTENVIAGDIVIAPKADTRFFHHTYSSLAALVEEVVRCRFSQMNPDATVVVAANQLHNQMVLHARKGQTIGLSYFEERYDLEKREDLRHDLSDASFAVTDTEHAAKKIREQATEQFYVRDISPFDTRLSLGRSQRIRELKIYMPVTDLEEEYLLEALKQVVSYMKGNPAVFLYLAARDEREYQWLTDAVKRTLMLCAIDNFGFCQEGCSVVCVNTKQGNIEAELQGTEEKAIAARVILITVRTEQDVIRRLDDVRLILDVRDQPDLYLQIAGISAGIPQVNYRFTRYVQHKKNGYIIQNIHYVTGALEYYLSELVHWNEALVYCVKEIEKYTSGSLVSVWKMDTARPAEESFDYPLEEDEQLV